MQGVLRNLLMLGLAVFVAAVVAVLAILGYRAYQLKQYDGPDYAADIEIVSSQLYFQPVREHSGKTVCIVGQARNVGTVAVDRMQLEIRLFNSAGAIIDSYRRGFNDHIGPGDDVSFKVSTHELIHLPEEEYASHKVIVRSATPR